MEKERKLICEFDYNGTKLKLLEPTASVIRESRFLYSKKFTEYLKSGFYTRKKLELLMSSDGDVNVIQEHLERRQELVNLLTDAQQKLEKLTDPYELEAMATLVSLYRVGLNQEDTSMSSLFANTVEQMADDDRLNYLTFGMVARVTGEPLWKTHDDFMAEVDYSLVDQCKYQVSCWEYNVAPNWRDSLPENIAIDRATKLKEASSKQIEVVSADAKPKKGRKKAKQKE